MGIFGVGFVHLFYVYIIPLVFGIALMSECMFFLEGFDSIRYDSRVLVDL